MATPRARRIYERTGKRVMIVDKRGQRRSHEAWLHNPYINCFDETNESEILVHCGGHRPYIQQQTPTQYVWKIWRPEPGELFLTPHEATFGHRHRGLVICEPNLKPRASPNKDWGWLKWCAFAELCRQKGIRLTQLGPAGTRMLPGAVHLPTDNMRLACAVMSQSTAYVGHEGGLHHVAAAFNRPGVVLFGGFIHPDQTGYPIHSNIFTGGTACGMRVKCDHCERAMNEIHPNEVFRQLERFVR